MFPPTHLSAQYALDSIKSIFLLTSTEHFIGELYGPAPPLNRQAP